MVSFLSTLETVLSVSGGGDTSIGGLVQYADGHVTGYITVLLADGKDRVTYNLEGRLITVFINGYNSILKQISEKYFNVDNITGEIEWRILD